MTMHKDAQSLILLTHEYPPFRGGIGTYCAEVAKAAAKLGVRVKVWAPTFGADASAAPQAENLEHRFFRGGLFRHWHFPRVLWLTLCALLCKPKGALLLAGDWPFVASCGLLRRVLPFRYSIMLHGSEILFFKRSKLFDLMTLGDPFYKADRIFVNSAFTASILFETYPKVEKSRVVVTYLGVDESWFGATDASQIRAACKIPAGRKIVLSVGRLHPRKGQARCIEALNELPASVRDEICYVIAGQTADAAYEHELRTIAANAKVPVVFTGAISNAQLRALYAESHVFCLPSQTHGTKVEGFGLVFLEAAGSGLPSIATRAGAVPEVVLEGETGLLVPPDQIAPLSAALQLVLTDDALRERLGQNALKRAQGFTWERCTRTTLDAMSEA